MTFASVLLSKTVVASAIAVLAEVTRRCAARPEPAYAMWATVLIVLLVPSVIAVPVPSWVSLTASLDLSSAPNEIWSGVFVIWLLGSGLVYWRQIRRLRMLEPLVRFAAPVNAGVTDRCSSIAVGLGIRRPPAVVTAKGAFSPFLWHPVKGQPRVVIPGELLDQLSAESTDAVLRHELIHLRRRDAWRRRLELLVLALWWWLPTTWIARCRLRELEELCIDEVVLKTNPAGAKAYARALLDTEEFLSRFQANDLYVVSAFARRGSLKARIMRIVTFEPTAATTKSSVFAVGYLATSALLGLLAVRVPPTAFSGAYAQHTAEPPSPWRVELSEESDEHTPNGEHQDVLSGMPDSDSVTVRNSNREIVLTWTGDGIRKDCRKIRLVRVSDDGVEPRLWRIDEDHDQALASGRVNKNELDWIFGFLSLKSEIIDQDGTRHCHPALVRLSALEPKEHNLCVGPFVA